MTARAYVYSGMWVADCPRPCGNVERLFTGSPGRVQAKKTEFLCTYCNFVTVDIEWPKDAEEIESILSLRPIPYNRNWYPMNHSVAVKFRIPHGQTPEELRAENQEHGVPAR